VMLEEGQPFRIFLELHVVGDPKCQGCEAGAPIPCTKPGCKGLVHSEKAADGNESGASVWTERCCDLCGDPEALSSDELDYSGLTNTDARLPPLRAGRDKAIRNGRGSGASTLREDAIEGYLADLAALAKQREDIDSKINLKERALRGILEEWAADPTTGNSSQSLEKEHEWERRLKMTIGPSSVGLTEAVRRVVWGAKPPGITARTVRDVIMSKYRILQGYSNPLAAVHTTLKRLSEGVDDIQQTTGEDGEALYRPPTGPLL